MHFITTASRRGGTSGFDADGGGGISLTCLYAIATGVSPVNGWWCASIS
jgi:hypothetical protein